MTNEKTEIFGFEGFVKDGFFVTDDLLSFHAHVNSISIRAWGWGQDKRSDEGTPEIELYKTKKYTVDGEKYEAVYFNLNRNECFVTNESYSQAKFNYSEYDELGKGFSLK